MQKHKNTILAVCVNIYVATVDDAVVSRRHLAVVDFAHSDALVYTHLKCVARQDQSFPRRDSIVAARIYLLVKTATGMRRTRNKKSLTFRMRRKKFLAVCRILLLREVKLFICISLRHHI